MKTNILHAVILAGLLTAARASAGYVLTPLAGGRDAAGRMHGQSLTLDIVLTADGDAEHTSSIFRLKFSEPGLIYEGYTWHAPYAGGTDDDFSRPRAADLPVVLEAGTLEGPGYPDGIVDIELSNVTAGAFQPPAFGTGTVVSLRFGIPPGFPAPATLTIEAVPDTLAHGFTSVPAAGGPAFTLNVIADTDLDGLPDWWENLHFGGPTNAVAAAPAANRINTVRECFLAGLDPGDPDALFKLTDISLRADGTILQWTASEDRLYDLYRSSRPDGEYELIARDLRQGAFTNSPNAVQPPQFYRVGVRPAR